MSGEWSCVSGSATCPFNLDFGYGSCGLVAGRDRLHCEQADEAEAELKRITPPNAKLVKLAKRFPAPQKWYDEESTE